MGVIKVTDDFDDRQLHLDAEAEQYHPYEYQTENNDSWAGALPVKQYVSTRQIRPRLLLWHILTGYRLGGCTIRPWRKMLAVSASLGKSLTSHATALPWLP